MTTTPLICAKSLLALIASSMLLYAAVLSWCADPQPQKPAASPPRVATPAYVQIADDPKLPRVLILGDSISIGYTLPVRKLLEGKANVHRPADNCGPSNSGLLLLDKWLGDGKWDVIHFNFGLHDLKYIDDNKKNTEPTKGH